MKFFHLAVIIFLISCKGASKVDTRTTSSKVEQNRLYLSPNPSTYEVVKLDSIDKVYLIYAKKGGSFFKIASKKENTKECSKIEVGEKYEFYLESLFPKKFLGKYDLSPQSLPHVNGVDFYGTTITLEPDSIKDLFIAQNIKGLCFMK